MLTMKKSVASAAAALFVSTTLMGAAQAQGTFNGDANGEEPIMPSAEVTAEAQADAPVDGTKDMVGDLNGEEPLTLKQQVETSMEADRVAGPETAEVRKDLTGDEPTNKPVIDVDTDDS